MKTIGIMCPGFNGCGPEKCKLKGEKSIEVQNKFGLKVQCGLDKKQQQATITFAKVRSSFFRLQIGK